jgi:sulfate permease, SulP family
VGERRFGAGDLIAGVSVAFVLVPQSLAYAELAGVPAYVGLFAAALPPILAAPFASSRYLQTGPVAMTALLTFGALAPLGGVPGSPEWIGLAALLAVMVGVIRVVLGLVRGGVLAYLLSQPVLLGFTGGAAILIVASQVPTALGYGGERAGLLETAVRALTSPGEWQGWAVAVAVATAVIVVVGRRVHPLFPGVLVAVAVGILIGTFTGYPGAEVGPVPAGLPPFSLALPWSRAFDLLVPALVVAVVGFAEPAAIARSFAAADRDRWDPDRELISQGVANLASGVSGGFPVGGSFGRTSIDRQAGARTRWSGAVTGLAVVAFLPFSGILESLPTAVLAAIVITAVVPLIKPAELVRLPRQSRPQAAIAWATLVATLALAPRIDLGVLVGVGLSVLVHIWRELTVPVESGFVDGRLTLAPKGVLFFASAPGLERRLLDVLARHPECTTLVLDLGGLGRVDYTGALALKAVIDDAVAAGVEVEVVAPPPQSRGLLARTLGTD